MNKLNFGCGTNILKGFVNVDVQKAPQIDKSFNFEKFPYPLEDNTFDYIIADNVLEHLSHLDKVVEELWRISKPNAKIRVIVPYWNASGMYQDWTHVNFMNEVAVKHLFLNPGYKYDKRVLFKNLKITFIKNRFVKTFPDRLVWWMAKMLNNMIMAMDIEVEVLK